MRTLWREQIQIFMVNKLLSGISGMTFGEWSRLLRKHEFAVDPPYWPRVTFITGLSLITSAFRRYENRIYSRKVMATEVRPPLFILGHQRSGTTHLHNLLALDKQFAYPNVYQALNPHTFLTTERYFGGFGFLSPKTRIVDNMRFGFEVPHEDEFATVGSLRSPLLGYVFPRWRDHYDRYLTFREVPEVEIGTWKTALVLFLKKLTWKYDRPLVLKSPPHTCRIRLLLDMFPDARFVHIHRDPYRVFQSTKRMTTVMTRAACVQRADSQDIDGWIIQNYKQMYDVFFEERELIPAGRLHEVCFEELERDPVRQIKHIYEALSLPGFDTVQPSLQHYVDSIANYRKNEYPELPSVLRYKIAQTWQRGFEEWGYAC